MECLNRFFFKENVMGIETIIVAMLGVIVGICICLSWFLKKGYSALGEPANIGDIVKPGASVRLLHECYSTVCGGKDEKFFLIEGPRRGRMPGTKRMVRIPDLANYDEISGLQILDTVRPGWYRYDVTRSVNLATGEVTTSERLTWLNPVEPAENEHSGPSLLDELSAAGPAPRTLMFSAPGTGMRGALAGSDN